MTHQPGVYVPLRALFLGTNKLLKWLAENPFGLGNYSTLNYPNMSEG